MDDEEDLDIAAAMGFSSFGGTKKRKHDQTESPQPKAGGSGANTTELGVRTKKAAGSEAVTNRSNDTAMSSDAPSLPVHKTKKQQQQPAAGLADFLARAQTLPERPPDANSDILHGQKDAATETRSFGGPSISTAELNALKYGVTNERGDTVIFLSNFVEDPWSKLNGPR